MKFSIKNFFSKCDQIRRKCGLVTFTEEILNGKLHFLCIVIWTESTVTEEILNEKLLFCAMIRN